MSLSLPQLAHKGVPVVTSETLAMVYEVKPVSIRKNFTTNKDRFIEGKHYYTLSGNDLREFKNRVTESNSVQIGKNAKSLTLWTERGAARHAKMLNSDKAWDMFELLEETFFRVVEQKQDDRISTVDDRRPLNMIVRTWAQASDQKYSMCWKQVNSAFGFESATEFPARWIPDAVAWVQEKIDSVETCVPAVMQNPPAELTAYGRGKDFWKDMEEAQAKIGALCSVVDVMMPTSRSLGNSQHAVLCDTLNSNVQIAHNCLVVAKQALKAALGLKREVMMAG